jgi:hypothetical protein
MKFICKLLMMILITAGAQFEAAAQISSSPSGPGSQNQLPGGTGGSGSQSSGGGSAADNLALRAQWNLDLGGVTIYTEYAMNPPYIYRRCLDSYQYYNSGNPVTFDCNFSRAQKWLLMRSGQIAYQSDPTQCLTWPSYSGPALFKSACQAQPDATQVFSFQTNGNISNINQSLCLNVWNNSNSNGTNVIAWGCNTDNNELWMIQPDPAVFYTLNDPVVSTANGAGAGNILAPPSNGAVGVQFANIVTPQTMNSWWFFTRSEFYDLNTNAFDIYYVQNAQNGYCLTFQQSGSGYSLDAAPCSTLGQDGQQLWTFGNGWTPDTQPVLGGPVLLTSYTGKLVVGSANGPGQPPTIQAQGDALQINPVTALLNTMLTNTDVTGVTRCFSADPGGVNIVANYCGSMTAVYAAAVDVMPDSTIRFRTTGQCLTENNYAGQWQCPNSVSLPANQQQWTAINTTSGNSYPNVGAWPIYTPVFTQNVGTGEYLNNTIISNQLMIRGAGWALSQLSQNDQWFFTPNSDVATCVDLSAVNSRSPRQVNLAGQLYDLFQTLITAFQNLPLAGQYTDVNVLIRNMQAMLTTLANPAVNLNVGDPNSQLPAIGLLATQATSDFHYWEADVGAAWVLPAEPQIQTIIGTTNSIMQLAGNPPVALPGMPPFCLWGNGLQNPPPGYGTTPGSGAGSDSGSDSGSNSGSGSDSDSD